MPLFRRGGKPADRQPLFEIPTTVSELIDKDVKAMEDGVRDGSITLYPGNPSDTDVDVMAPGVATLIGVKMSLFGFGTDPSTFAEDKVMSDLVPQAGAMLDLLDLCLSDEVGSVPAETVDAAINGRVNPEFIVSYLGAVTFGFMQEKQVNDIRSGLESSQRLLG